MNKLSELMYYYLTHDDRYEPVAFSVDDEYCNTNEFMGLPVVKSSDLNKTYPPETYGIILTIGYSSMNNNRKDKFNALKSKGYDMLTYCHPSSVILTDNIGEGCLILENCTIGAYCELGRSNILFSSTTIAHHSKTGDFNFFAPESAIAGEADIKDNCFFGINCTVKNSVTISAYTLVGAGVYISKNTEEYGVYVPERAIKLSKTSLEIKL